MLPYLGQSNVRKVNITELARSRGMSEAEVENHIKGLVEQGFFKKVGKNKYDVTPFLTMLLEYEKQTRSGQNVDVKELVSKVTRK